MNDGPSKEENTPDIEPDLLTEETEGESAKAERRSKKMKSTHPLPNSSPEILSKILKAYVIASKQGAEAVKYTDVAAVAGMHPTAVSGNNAFLSGAGLILPERYGFYKPSPEATEFAKQAPWDEETAKGRVRDVIDKTWFGETVQQQFQLQSPLNKSQLIRAFGIKASADQSDTYKLDLLVDFLIYFEFIVQDEGGSFVLPPNRQIATPTISHSVDAYVVESPTSDSTQPLLPQAVNVESVATPIAPHININLSLTPETTDEELGQLADRVKALINMLAGRTK